MNKFFKGFILIAIATSCLYILTRETELTEVVRTGFIMIGLILYLKFLSDFWDAKK